MNQAKHKRAALEIFRKARQIRKADKSKDGIEFRAVRHEMYRAAIALDPEQFGSLRYLALQAYAEKNYTKALELFRRADKALPNRSNIQYGIATSIFCQTFLMSDESRAYLDKALTLNPDLIDNDFVKNNASGNIIAEAHRKRAARKNKAPLLFGLIAASAGLSAYSNQIRNAKETIKSLAKNTQ
jgi:tetratricopeptide (TPR) repeat protein